MDVADLPSPALVVDLAAADRNIARAEAWFATRAVRLRPHFKAHKCTRLMRRQLAAAGTRGVTCATAHEAEVLVGAGFEDVLVANEVADPAGLAALARAGARTPGLLVCVDSRRHVELLSGAGVRCGVLIEIDVGQRRCGLAPGDGQLLAIARQIMETPGLDLRGLQGYHGHAVLLADRDERAREVVASAAVLTAERERLLEAGLPCDIVSGGGTGTFDLASQDGTPLDEVQAGSYVLMDATYGALGLPFEHALFCHTTVVSRHGTRVVLDAGLKALSAEYGPPAAADPGLEVLSLADEHATCRVAETSALRVGEAVRLVPGHVDPTVNLHPALHVEQPDGTFEAWPVDGRR